VARPCCHCDEPSERSWPTPAQPKPQNVLLPLSLVRSNSSDNRLPYSSPLSPSIKTLSEGHQHQTAKLIMSDYGRERDNDYGRETGGGGGDGGDSRRSGGGGGGGRANQKNLPHHINFLLDRRSMRQLASYDVAGFYFAWPCAEAAAAAAEEAAAAAECSARTACRC
jgi:hypothetical protein